MKIKVKRKRKLRTRFDTRRKNYNDDIIDHDDVIFNSCLKKRNYKMPTDSTYNSISYNSTVVTSTTIVATSSSTPWPLFSLINKYRVCSLTNNYDSMMRYTRKSFIEWHIKWSNCWYTRKVNKQRPATILEFYPSVWL